MDIKTKVGMGIFTCMPIIAGIGESIASTGHVRQESWPDHALFVVLMGLGGVTDNLRPDPCHGPGTSQAGRMLVPNMP